MAPTTQEAALSYDYDEFDQPWTEEERAQQDAWREQEVNAEPAGPARIEDGSRSAHA